MRRNGLRAAAAVLITRSAVVLVLLFATVPVPLHTYRCRGFVECRPFLDSVEPGSAVASYEPRFPAGPSRAPGQWYLRAEAPYYLDRLLVNFARPEQLAGAPYRFIISLKDYHGVLAEVGYEVVMPLGKRYWLLCRRPATNMGPSALANKLPAGGTESLPKAFPPQ